nr:MAG TPA: hypothetical protein [Caudoviricetes sp.]
MVGFALRGFHPRFLGRVVHVITRPSATPTSASTMPDHASASGAGEIYTCSGASRRAHTRS